ncbi:MAG: rhodanese-like domain-containing protein [Deltaproteobacteria bacterium]|nr:rhodanese-like domain-containing protein [Deltaproteobacteria bacterium]
MILKETVRGFVSFVAVMLFCMQFILPVSADENKPETPKALDGVKVVSVEDVKALIAKNEAKFFDFRSAINYGKGHMPGAIALPYKENSEFKADFDASKDVFDMSKLPSDKNTQMVFYSDGPTGWKSYKAALLARKAGYKRVMWFREGTKAWEAKGNRLQ